LGDKVLKGDMTIPEAQRAMAGLHQREPGDESETGGESPVEPTAEQLDNFIAALQLDPKEAFEAAQHVDDLLRAISRVKQLMERVGNGPAGRLLDMEREMADLKKMRERVKGSRPYAVCPKPVNAGDHSGCKICKGAGFISKEQVDKIPSAYRSLALHKFEEMDFPSEATSHRRIPLGHTCMDDPEFNAKGFSYLRWLTDQPKRCGISHRAQEAVRLRELWNINCNAYDDFLMLAARVQHERATMQAA
jgi:hypothetical protein